MNFFFLKPIFLILSAYTVTHILLDYAPGKIGREILYGWFLVMIFFMIGINFFDWLYAIPRQSAEFITGGMIFFMLLVYLFYVQIFFGKGKDKIPFQKFISSKYSTFQISRNTSLLTILVQGGILIINHIYTFISPQLLINLSLILFPFVMHFLPPQSAPARHLQK